MTRHYGAWSSVCDSENTPKLNKYREGKAGQYSLRQPDQYKDAEEEQFQKLFELGQWRSGEMATQTSAVVSLIPKYAVSSRKHTLMMLFQWPLPPSCEEQDDTKVTSVRVSQHTAQNSVALSDCESINATPTFMQTEATSH